MDILQWFQELHLDPTIILIVIASGFFQNKYFAGFTVSKDKGYDAALKTLALSAFVSIVYIILLGEQKDTLSFYLISYFTATSFYELLIKPVVKLFTKD